MKTVNFDFYLENVDGTITQSHAGRELSKLLSSNAESKNALKAWEMSKTLYKDGKLKLDTSDFEFLKSEIESIKGMFPIFKGQVLIAINEAKETK